MSTAASVRRARDYFATGVTRPLAFRRRQLEQLAAALEQHEARLLTALQSDLGKSPFQALSSEFGPVRAEIRQALRQLSRWSAPSRRRTPRVSPCLRRRLRRRMPRRRFPFPMRAHPFAGRRECGVR